MNVELENCVSEDINITHRCTDAGDRQFDLIIGCIEEIILSEEFLNLQANFMEANWRYFENDEENKIVYIEIFQKYCGLIENFIGKELIKRIPEFTMSHLEDELRKRQDDLDGEIFEILATFTDFLSFKNEILDYKAIKEGKTIDTSKEFFIKKL